MAKQTINIGASPNDGTGTPLRTSFDYCNQNFTELYAALGGGTGLPGASTQVIFNDGGSNLAGDAGMTYNKTTDTMSLVNLILSGNTTLGDAQADTSTINGQLTARQGEFPSAVRAAASDYAAVNFDGATASTRIAAPCQALGTGDFSLWSRFRVPTSNPSGNAGVLLLSDTDGNSTRPNAFFVYITSAGILQTQRYGSTTSDNRLATISGFRSAYSGQVVDLVITRSGNTLKIYINGADTAYVETTAGTPPVWGDTVVSSFFNVGCLSSTATTIFSGRIYRSVVFNRALSAADVVEVGTTGVNPADQWGTQTDIINATTLNGGFETAGGGGADVFANWAEVTSGSSTINRDTSIFYAGTASCRFDLDITGNSVSIQSATFARNKRYRVSCFARSTATNGRLSVNVGSTSFSPFGAVLDNLSWQERVLEFVTEGGGSDTFVISRFSGSLNGSIWIDNVTFTRIGAIVDLDFTVGTGYQATDRSSNALHGTLFNGVEFTQPKRVAVLYATTNTNGNQQMLGTLAIPTNAIIEDIIVNSTGSATVSVGNASAGTQIVNGASVVSGRQKLTIATPFSTTGNLWVNSNATATLQFTILYTIAS